MVIIFIFAQLLSPLLYLFSTRKLNNDEHYLGIVFGLDS